MPIKNKGFVFQEPLTFCEKKENASPKTEQKQVIFFFSERPKNESSPMLVLLLDAKVENLYSYMPPLQEGLSFLLYVRAIGIRPMRKHDG